MARDIPQEEIDARLQEDLDLAEEERGSVLDRLASEDPDLVFVKAHTRRKPTKRERLAVPEMAQEALEASVAPPVAQPSPPPIPPGVTAPPGGGGVGPEAAAAAPGLGLLGKAGAVGGIVAGAKAAFDLLKPDETIGKVQPGGHGRTSFGTGGGSDPLEGMLKLANRAADIGFPAQTGPSVAPGSKF